MSNIFPGGILLLGWISTSIPRPPIKRAAAIAIVYGFGNIGQIPALYLWPSKWAPKYRQSCTAELCFLLFSLATGLGPFQFTSYGLMKSANRRLGYRQYLVYLNKKLENGEVEVFKTDEKVLKTSAKYVASPLSTHCFVDFISAWSTPPPIRRDNSFRSFDTSCRFYTYIPVGILSSLLPT